MQKIWFLLGTFHLYNRPFRKLWSTFWKANLLFYSPEESSRCQLHTHHSRRGSPALVSVPLLWRNHMRVLSWQVLPCLPFLLGHTIKTEPPQPSFPLLIVIKALESNLILLIGKPLEMAILTCFTLPSAQKCPPCKLVDAKVQLEFRTTRRLEKLPILALQTPSDGNMMKCDDMIFIST